MGFDGLSALAFVAAALFFGFWIVNKRMVERADDSQAIVADELETGYVDADHPIDNMTARARHLRLLAGEVDDPRISAALVRMADEEEADANILERERLS